MTENAPAGRARNPKPSAKPTASLTLNTDADSDTTIGPSPRPTRTRTTAAISSRSRRTGTSGKELVDGISDAIPNSVDVEIPKVELTNKDAITASRNDLSSNLTSMGDIVSNLNSNASSNSQALINDVRAISNQINKIGQTLSGASDNIKDPDDVVDDISDRTPTTMLRPRSRTASTAVWSTPISTRGITGPWPGRTTWTQRTTTPPQATSR